MALTTHATAASRVDAGLTGQPVAVRWFARVAVVIGLFVMKRKVAHGDFDDTEESLNASLEESLAKLKALIEAPGRGPRGLMTTRQESLPRQTARC